MKLIMVVSLLSLVYFAQAQKSSHQVFMGANVSSIKTDYSQIGLNYKYNSKFKGNGIGTNLSYEYLRNLRGSLYASIGLELNNTVTRFTRPHYYNNVSSQPSNIDEELKLQRIQIPIQLQYNFQLEKKNLFFLKAGSAIIVSNVAKRSADYTIPSPPTGSVSGKFENRKSLRFSNDNSVGYSFLATLGKEIKIGKSHLISQLTFSSDLTSTKIQTLQNIEDDASFKSTFSSIDLKIGYRF